jgi:hypothetical protein
LRNAEARGGAIGEAGQEWLAEAVATIDVAVAPVKAAELAEANARAAVLAEDARCNLEIANVRDEMWHAIGRQRGNPSLELVFPEGVATYTEVDPRTKPLLMKLLVSRILAGAAPQWTKEKLAGWAARIEDLRQSFDKAVVSLLPAEADAMIARVTYRSAVRLALMGLRRFKRDLLNMGLSETQIHEIIPDATRPTADPGGPPEKPDVLVPKAA